MASRSREASSGRPRPSPGGHQLPDDRRDPALLLPAGAHVPPGAGRESAHHLLPRAAAGVRWSRSPSSRWCISLTFVFRSGGIAMQETTIALIGDRLENLRVLERFGAWLAAILGGALTLVAVTPLSRVWFEQAAGLPPDLAGLAIVPLRICLPGAGARGDDVAAAVAARARAAHQRRHRGHRRGGHGDRGRPVAAGIAAFDLVGTTAAAASLMTGPRRREPLPLPADARTVPRDPWTTRIRERRRRRRRPRPPDPEPVPRGLPEHRLLRHTRRRRRHLLEPLLQRARSRAACCPV